MVNPTIHKLDVDQAVLDVMQVQELGFDCHPHIITRNQNSWCKVCVFLLFFFWGGGVCTSLKFFKVE